MKESKGITCKLLNGTEVLLSEGDRVLAVRMVEGGIPITTDADSIIDDVLVTLSDAQQTIKTLKYNVDHWEGMAFRLADSVELLEQETIRLREVLKEALSEAESGLEGSIDRADEAINKIFSLCNTVLGEEVES